MYSGAVEQYSLYLVDRGRLSNDLVGESGGAVLAAGGVARGTMTDALEACDFPGLSDELTLSDAAALSGERSRISPSSISGLVGGCSSRRGFVRSPAFVSVSETGECGRFWDGESVSIPSGSVARIRFGEDGRGGATGEIDPGDSESIADGSVGQETTRVNMRGLVGSVVDLVSVGGDRPETTVANVRGLEGGVVDMASLFGAVGGSTGFISSDTMAADRVAFFRGHFLASWPEAPHRKQDRI